MDNSDYENEEVDFLNNRVDYRQNNEKEDLSYPIKNLSQYPLNLRQYKILKNEHNDNVFPEEMYIISKEFLKKWKRNQSEKYFDNIEDSFEHEQINSDLLDSKGVFKSNLREKIDYKLVSKGIWELVTENLFSLKLTMKMINGKWQYVQENLCFITKKTIKEKNITCCKIDKIFAHMQISPNEIYEMINSKLNCDKSHHIYDINGINGKKPTLLLYSKDKPIKIWRINPQNNKSFEDEINYIKNFVQNKGKAFVNGQVFLNIPWNEMLAPEILRDLDNLLVEVKDDDKSFFLYNDDEFFVGLCDKCEKKTVLSYICPCKIMTYCSEKCKQEDQNHRSQCEKLNLKRTVSNQASYKMINENIDDHNNNHDKDIHTNNFTFNNNPIKKSESVPVGLENLGNTCYMNAALQCLSHITELTEFFLNWTFENDNMRRSSRYQNEINLINNYVLLLRNLKSNTSKWITTKFFKHYLSAINSMFSGNTQQDAQEFIVILLDAFHEGLKNDCADKEILKFYEKLLEKNHSDEKQAKIFQDYYNGKCGHSIITKLLQGLFKSEIKCKNCGQISRNFEPFFVCPVPIIKRSIKEVEIYYEHFSPNYSFIKLRIKYEKQKKITINDIKKLIGERFKINHESLLVISIENMKFLNGDILIGNFLKQTFNKKILIRDYLDFEKEIPIEDQVLMKFSIKTKGNNSDRYYKSRSCDQFIIINKNEKLYQVHYRIYLYLWTQKLLGQKLDLESFQANVRYLPYALKQPKNFYLDYESEDFPLSITQTYEEFLLSKKKKSNDYFVLDVEFKEYLELLLVVEETLAHGEVNEMINSFDIYDCLKYMTREEDLDESNKWNCPTCKTEQLCSKKFEIYQTGPILILYFKRYKNFPLRKKINTKIVFPIEELNLDNFIISNEFPKKFELFAICNHYGDASHGHYTAYCKNQNSCWFYFNDEHVEKKTDLNEMVTEKAYILFYKRKSFF